MYLSQINSNVLIFEFVLLLLISLFIYFAITYPFYKLAKKADYNKPWLAFIPILNTWQLVKIARLKVIWFILLFIPYVSIIAYIMIMVKYLQSFGRSGWMVLMFIFPITNIIYPYYLAYSYDVEYENFDKQLN